MSHGKRKRKSASGVGPDAPELNIMPFIDIFSMLNTFLLVSAAFIGFGIVEVQIPFLSNSPEVKDLPQRSFSVRVDVEETKIILTTQWTANPIEKTEKPFALDPAGIESFHQEMIATRTKVPENDKVNVYSDKGVKYQQLVQVLDAIKTLKENDPPINLPATDTGAPRGASSYLFEKVVIGSVIL